MTWTATWHCHLDSFIEDMLLVDGFPAWIVGNVVNGSNTAKVLPNVKIIEV